MADPELDRERRRQAVDAGHAHADLFLAALDGASQHIYGIAARTSLETRSEAGMTAMMLAARYGQHVVISALLSAGAKIGHRTLIAAIEAGNLVGLRILLGHGASLGIEQPAILRAACAQPDSDLLRFLLERIDIAPYPELRGASTEAERLLRNARAGRRPPARPIAASWRSCLLCRDLPDEQTAPLPEVTVQFETFGVAGKGLWKCPHCGTYYEHDRHKSERLTRVARVKALEALRAMTPEPRLEREIAALTGRVTFDDVAAAPGGRKFRVSDPEVEHGARVLMIYCLSGGGAQRLAYLQVSEAEHDELVADLTARGFPLAETDFSCGKRMVFEAAGHRATLEDGRVVARADVARVVAFAVDYAYRGVKATLRSGKEVHLVTEVRGAEMSNRNELICETVWCSTLGVAIAAWAGTDFVDHI